MHKITRRQGLEFRVMLDRRQGLFAKGLPKNIGVDNDYTALESGLHVIFMSCCSGAA